MLDHAAAMDAHDANGAHDGDRIGPNAILQLQAPVAARLGPGAMAQVLSLCDVAMPDGDRMIPQRDVARVHAMFHRLFPGDMDRIAEQAGRATAHYIRTNRIPPLARKVLGLLPLPISERLLTRAILAHAWTFCGTGHASARRRSGALEIAVADNPLVDPDSTRALQCGWHAAVFAELFSALLRTGFEARETECCGSGAPACRFVIRRTGR
jgi:divinyl protochlorophyllide a 8-vinyl-reductase